MLPNFLVVGAQKAGTTTVARTLASHPDVFVSDPRETFFFASDLEYPRGAAFYERRYFTEWNGEHAVGEKTPEYLLLDHVPDRILDTLGPRTRIVISLRDPGARAHSQWRHNLQGLREHLPFEEAIEAEPSRARDAYERMTYGYVARGRYAAQVERYLDRFDDVLVLVAEGDLGENTLADTLFGFLGVDPTHRPPQPIHAGRPRIPELIRPSEATTIEGRRGSVEVPAGAIAYRYGGGRIEVIRDPSPAQATYADHFALVAPTADGPLDEAERLRINRSIADNIERTATLIGRDLSGWLA